VSAEPRERERSEFWTGNQPGFRFTDAEPGTERFYAEVEAHRYALEPAIPELARFADWRERDVLEAGCGIATDGINFARAGARYTGVDFSDAAIALARRRFELESMPGEFVQASITELPAEDSSRDLVYSNGVIHHLPETEAVVAEMHRVLRPGGRAIVMVYHRDSLNYRFNIMVVRRLLALVLLIPGAAERIGRMASERAEVFTGHRRLLAEHGGRYLRDKQLFLNNNTDGPDNPLSKVYSRADAQELFSAFSTVETRVRFLNLRLYPKGDAIAGTAPARRLERQIGWHLWIEAVK
jgi:ubiquinone/menaquinone biosynthesis C-methylase UbiE